MFEFSCKNCSEWTKETKKELKNNSKGEKSPFDKNV